VIVGTEERLTVGSRGLYRPNNGADEGQSRGELGELFSIPRGGNRTYVRSDMRSHWHRPGYWRWWWQEVVRDHTKRGLIAMLALGFPIAGFLSADQLVGTQEATTFTTQRVITVVRTTTGPALTTTGPALTTTTTGPALTTTTTEPGETDLVTVRQDRTVVVREPGETVTKAVTVRGPVQERVVTDRRVDEVVRTETVDRLRNVTRPGRTETVTREVTQPARTVEVTQPARTVTETLTREVPVTKEVTVTDKTTVTDVVTVTTPVTVTEQVTVTVTVKK